ncbi:MAG TPA: hypothetical protein VJ983_05170, partial [candidate division Zixibacteria bacterium]|nr:hypothetical protein [candidate division Zixibacteria bacterium]
RLAENTWRRELQPSAELLYNTPLFSLGSTVNRRISKSSFDANDLNRDNWSVYYRSKWVTYPGMVLRYDWNRTYAPDDLRVSNQYDRRWLANLDYTYKGSQFYYNLVRLSFDNRPREQKLTEYDHQFRWNQMALTANKKLRINSDYTFTYKTQTQETPDTAVTYRQLPVRSGLYSIDASPEFDSLTVASGLTDGNTVDPSLPLIDIGTAQVDRNIGADLGLSRKVAAIYIYTDRPSGAQLNWTIYSSDDNLTWNLVSVAPNTRFSLIYNRYEIEFPGVTTRYIKAVNSGTNNFSTVDVTEIQVYEGQTGSSKRKSDQQSHLLDVVSTYTFTQKLQGTLDLSYQNEPGSGDNFGNDELYVNLSGRYRPNDILTHVARAQIGFQNYEQPGAENLRNRSLSYSLLYQPLQTLRFTVSALNYRDYVGGRSGQENTNLIIQTYGNVLNTLNASLEGGVSRNHQYATETAFDTYTGRLSFDGSPIRRIDFLISYLYQNTVQRDGDQRYRKDQLGTSVTFRMTRTIFVRGNLDLQKDVATYRTQTYNIGWNMFPKLAVGSLIRLIDSGSDINSDQYNVYANLKIRMRASLYFSYIYNKVSDANGNSKLTTLQLGFKTGF